jgi:uncharacterized protein (DUF2236 family)
MLRRVIGEQVVGLSAPRALLMQAAHPVAFAGFFAHTGALDDPYRRLARTAHVMNLIAFGPARDARRATRRVRAMHRRVRGTLREPVGRFAAGTPYAGDDPALLLWILAALADSAVVVYERYVGSLTRAERDALWAEYRTVGGEFALREADMPASWDDFRAYVDDMVEGPDLHVSDEARRLALQIVMRPPVPLHLRPLLELANQVTIGLLPARLRREYGFRWDPVREVAVRGGAEYAKRLIVPLLPERVRLVPGARRAA